ncbi:hypothetical protein OH492_10440 [Vibrio chagasii]|nr:hypothetical protein [Vibrio chagasii]
MQKQGYEKPTSIQEKAIPIVLLARTHCGQHKQVQVKLRALFSYLRNAMEA